MSDQLGSVDAAASAAAAAESSSQPASVASFMSAAVEGASEQPAAAPASEMVLPEGYSVMFGEDGQQYVTVVQDDQTYAFPAEEFHQMQQVSEG